MFLVQVRANRQSVVRIDRGIAFFDVLDNTVLVYDDIGALSPLVGITLNVVAFKDAVSGQHLLVHIAQEREFDVDLLGESGVGRGRIHTDAEDFRIGGINFAAVDSRLDRLELLRSTTSEGENVNGQKDVLFALKVAELDWLPLIAQKGEIGSWVADFERNSCDLFLLRDGRKGG